MYALESRATLKDKLAHIGAHIAALINNHLGDALEISNRWNRGQSPGVHQAECGGTFRWFLFLTIQVALGNVVADLTVSLSFRKGC